MTPDRWTARPRGTSLPNRPRNHSHLEKSAVNGAHLNRSPPLCIAIFCFLFAALCWPLLAMASVVPAYRMPANSASLAC
jgi:hypothetical protein